MALNPQQQQVGQMLYQLAVQRGLSPQHAREFVSAGFAESGLNPHADNPRTHARGLFQLLSRGYRQRAQQLGGLDNPRANALAILPSYQRYWRQHPHAMAGAAGRDVELSGAGAGFYSRGLAQLGNLGGGPPNALQSEPPTGRVSAAPDQQDIGRALLQAFQAGPSHGDLSNVYSLVNQRDHAAKTAHLVKGAVGGLQATGKPVTKGNLINELFYDPLGGIKHGAEIGAIGHHGDHVHVALGNGQAQLAAIAQAKRMGLHVGEERASDVNPVHVKSSYHYRSFGKQFGNLREAADVSGSPAQMAAYYRWVKGRYG